MTQNIHIRALIAVAATLVAGGSLVFAVQYPSVAPDTLPALVQQASSTRPLPALPERLRIPVLAIDANVQHVGRTATGLMANPSNFTDVGWYAGRARPGQEGSAVMAGHVDNALALNGVFKRLKELRAGDEVYVDTEEGKTLRFKVTSSAVYPYKEVPLDGLFNKQGAPYLHLVTCHGVWLPKERSYSERLVVYAELVL